jgi:hypothetical protein
VRFISGARQSFFKNDALFVLIVEEGKILCRASWRKHTANKIFAVCFISDAQQSFLNDASFVRSGEQGKVLCRWSW